MESPSRTMSTDIAGRARDAESAVRFIRTAFPEELARALGLSWAASPLALEAGTGLNDDLNGTERPVSFSLGSAPGVGAEIPQSLAKWKRARLARGGFKPGEGIWTEMNALRPDEIPDDIHSIHVDQWDWEAVIDPADRNVGTLERAATAIWDCVLRTAGALESRVRVSRPRLRERVAFLHADELAARWPVLAPKEREDAACREHGTVFLVGIGGALSDGKPHDGRAPDYDDWSSATGGRYGDRRRGLNGDLLVWNERLGRAFELSSMGIRVDPGTLERQLGLRGAVERAKLPFHASLLEGGLPQTMGGGIGISRLCMFLLGKRHIGEVMAAVWPPSERKRLEAEGVALL